MPDKEVTSAEIARLARVRPTAVSNWRRRHEDFPRPVGGPRTSPTFALPEVEAWLEANGKQADDARRTPQSEPRFGQAQAELARVVASLLPSGKYGLVLDPACGTGLMLAAAASRLGPSVAYAGQDPDRSKVEVAATELADAGVRSAELLVGSPLVDDALSRYRGAADAVVCLPPGKSSWLADEATLALPWAFGPPSQLDPYLAWLQICYAYLKPGGAAVTPMPTVAAVRASGRRVRAEMLRAGALRQVVALPEYFARDTSSPWQVWILRRPADRPMYTVRLVDLRGAQRDDVPTDHAGWRAVYRDEAVTRDVASIELLDEDVLLLPSRHIEVPLRDIGPDYDRLRARLARAAAAVEVTLPAFRGGTGTASFPMTSVMDLIRLRALEFIDKGAEVMAGDVVVPAGADRFDASVVGDHMPVRVAGDVLRCDPELIDPYFLACFLRSESNRRLASGTLGGTSRLDLRRARVPQMPLAEQQRYGHAFRRLTAVTDRIGSVAALATDAVQTAVYGLTSGLFVPDDAS
jgi:SAM-dependent methyltransferase